MVGIYNFTSDTVQNIANATYWIYDIFIFASFIFKFIVIIFFINNFIHKTLNFHTTFMYLQFFGFMIDIISWFIDLLTRLCYKVWFIPNWKTPNYDCEIFKNISTIAGQYNNSFSVVWILLLSINRLTAIVWFTKYQRVWKKLFKPSIVFLLLSPFGTIGYTFFNFDCRFFLPTCKEGNFWIIFGDVVGIVNGTLSGISFIISLIAAKIYQRKKLTNSLQNVETKLIYQAGITSFICALHYIFYYIAQFYFTDYRNNPETFLWGIDLVIIDGIKFLAYPCYHFSSFILLFVFSPTIRKQLFAFLHLLKFYEIVEALCSSSNSIAALPSLSYPSSSNPNQV